MAAAFTLPRFLLPQSGLIWRRANLGNRLRDSEVLIVRYASSTPGKEKRKPLVLEKPEKFNPPSHGARLPRKNRPQQQHYGGALSDQDVAAQRVKDYPGMPPPPNTWAHWFLRTPMIHTVISMGTLLSLAVYAYVENFKAKSPFADMLPEASDYLWHPLVSLQATKEVWKLTVLHESHAAREKRKHKGDDVVKRREYWKAHEAEAVDSWFGPSKTPSTQSDPKPLEKPAQNELPQKREKFLGIF